MFSVSLMRRLASTPPGWFFFHEFVPAKVPTGGRRVRPLKAAKIMSLIGLTVAVVASGCSSSTKITCLESAYVPNGKYMAKACTYDTVGPGINALSTQISIKDVTGKDEGSVVLSFENESTPSHKSAQFAVLWLSGEKVEIIFNEMPTKIYRQADKFGSVSVTTSVR